MADTKPIFDAAALRPIAGTTLFYPCSGDDLSLPLTVFSPYCDDFWFVDIGYFHEHPPRRPKPILSVEEGYELLNASMQLAALPEEEWSDDPKYQGRAPEILTETYVELDTGRQVRVHRHRRRGPSAMRRQIDRLGVFFYRGDSAEGGSGTLWLTVREWHRRKRRRRWLIHEVLDKLIDGGLIVTDGSMCLGAHSPYRELRRLHGNVSISSEQAIGLGQPFADDQGRTFHCIGCLGQHYHYGPTMVWQVQKGGSQ